MKSKFVWLTVLVVCFAMSTTFLAQGKAAGGQGKAAPAASDAITGTWSGDWGPSASDRNQVTVDLKFDGKGGVTGTVNPGPNKIELMKSTFDAKTGAVHMEADAPGRGGAVHFIIDGKLEKGVMTGSWNHDKVKGDFKITKK